MRSFDEYVVIAENGISELMKVPDCPQKTVFESMAYSVMAGGKRLRPVLCLAAFEAFGGDYNDIMPVAAAIEMIHTFSLIHDDLPCMDNDDYRRGRLTNHKVYGEDIATLSGDALVILAFETAAKANILPDRCVKIISTLASYSGANGMIGGQVVDLESENKEISAETLEFLHTNKTSALIRMSLECGAIAAGADEKSVEALRNYGLYLGLAFQVQDDILDVIGDSEVLGKPAGSDAENGKSTYVSMYGLEGAKKLSDDYTSRAISALDEIPGKSFFEDFAKMLLKRKN